VRPQESAFPAKTQEIVIYTFSIEHYPRATQRRFFRVYLLLQLPKPKPRRKGLSIYPEVFSL